MTICLKLWLLGLISMITSAIGYMFGVWQVRAFVKKELRGIMKL